MAALLAALALASPTSAAENLVKSCPPRQIDYSTDGSLICGSPPIREFSKSLNCKVGEAPVWISGGGYTCAPFSGNLTFYEPKCPDDWHLVFTTQNAPMCAWVLREPGH